MVDYYVKDQYYKIVAPKKTKDPWDYFFNNAFEGDFAPTFHPFPRRLMKKGEMFQMTQDADPNDIDGGLAPAATSDLNKWRNRSRSYLVLRNVMFGKFIGMRKEIRMVAEEAEAEAAAAAAAAGAAAPPIVFRKPGGRVQPMHWEYDCGDGKTSSKQSDGKRYNIIIKIARSSLERRRKNDGIRLDEESPRHVFLHRLTSNHFVREAPLDGPKNGLIETTTISVAQQPDPPQIRISPAAMDEALMLPLPRSRWKRFWTKDRVKKPKQPPR